LLAAEEERVLGQRRHCCMHLAARNFSFDKSLCLQLRKNVFWGGGGGAACV